MDKLSGQKPSALVSRNALPRSRVAIHSWCGDWTVWPLDASLDHIGRGSADQRHRIPITERGRNGGRPKVAADETKVVLAKKLHADKSLEIDDVCKTLRISRSTFYRYVRL